MKTLAGNGAHWSTCHVLTEEAFATTKHNGECAGLGQK